MVYNGSMELLGGSVGLVGSVSYWVWGGLFLILFNRGGYKQPPLKNHDGDVGAKADSDNLFCPTLKIVFVVVRLTYFNSFIEYKLMTRTLDDN